MTVNVCVLSHEGKKRREKVEGERAGERGASVLTKVPSCVWRADAKECCLRMGRLMPLRNASSVTVSLCEYLFYGLCAHKL